MNPDKPLRSPLRFIFLASASPALLGVMWLFFRAPAHWRHLLVVSLLTSAGYLWIRHRERAGRDARWMLTACVLNLLVVAPEVGLRLFDFRYETGIHFAYPKSFRRFVPDPDLLWTLPPGDEGVNSLGFAGDEIVSPKPAGRCRILFLGDSVPAGGYAQRVQELLNRGERPVRYEGVNLAMPGYSSHQGRAVVDKFGRLVDPDLVVVSFGWNDHWLAYGAVDSQKVIRTERTAWEALASIVYRRSRLLQAARYVAVPLLGKDVPLSAVRVPEPEYVRNLAYIGELFSRRAVPVIFLTAPTSHHALGVPGYLVEQGFAVDKRSVSSLHQRYNEAVRALTSAKGWPLLDLERELEPSDDLSALFHRDGIHLTAAGLRTVTERIAEFLAPLGCPAAGKARRHPP